MVVTEHRTTTIEVFADVACPFTHVGLRRLVEARRAQGSHVGLRIRAWPLEWVNGSPLDPRLIAAEVAALRQKAAPDLFSGFDVATFPRTSIPAFGLAAAAYGIDETLGEAVSLAVRDALFERGRDVGHDAVIGSIARKFGVDPFDEEDAAASARDDWQRGVTRGVRGSPHFFLGERDWFCPSLDIRHADGTFDVHDATDAMRDFYAAVLN